jgi:hypothetical protein
MIDGLRVRVLLGLYESSEYCLLARTSVHIDRESCMWRDIFQDRDIFLRCTTVKDLSGKNKIDI